MIKELLASDKLRIALFAALLGAISAFALSFWGVHLDFSGVTAQDLAESTQEVEELDSDSE